MPRRTFVGLYPGYLSEREDGVTVAAREVSSGVGSGVGDPQ